jgi:hypothetical protein
MNGTSVNADVSTEKNAAGYTVDRTQLKTNLQRCMIEVCWKLAPNDGG